MSIECYEVTCPFHGEHHGEEGPFCFQRECRVAALVNKTRAEILDQAITLVTGYIVDNGYDRAEDVLTRFKNQLGE